MLDVSTSELIFFYDVFWLRDIISFIQKESNNWPVALVGYLVGSVPFGLIFTRVAGFGDIRTLGSGNIGATNVLRTGGRKLAVFTLLCDFLKGFISVIVFSILDSRLSLQEPSVVTGTLAGFCAFIGHLFPIWIGFKGGKGIATFLGVLLGIFWFYAVVFIFVWLLMARISRYSSLSSLLATGCVALASCLIAPTLFSSFIINLMGFIIVLKHCGNILRLYKGTESKIL